MEWEQHKELFEWDGSLLDIYILDTTMDDWQRLLDCLRDSMYELRYSVDDEALPLPERVEAIFARWPDAGPVLKIDVPHLYVNCHFFITEMIEFDVDSRAVDGQSRLDRLVQFIGLVVESVGKEVLLAPENLPELPLWRFTAR